MSEVREIYLTSGVNESGEGFVTVAVHSDKGEIWIGQLPPNLVRKMALDWLSSAEAAEQDAAVLRTLRKLELPDELAGVIITELRESRDE